MRKILILIALMIPAAGHTQVKPTDQEVAQRATADAARAAQIDLEMAICDTHIAEGKPGVYQPGWNDCYMVARAKKMKDENAAAAKTGN
jgi:hypothetical protein